MTVIYADATVLIALGNAGRLDLLGVFDGRVTVSDAVASEVSTEPAASNFQVLLNFEKGSITNSIQSSDERQKSIAEAKELLNETEINGDVAIIAHVIQHCEKDSAVAVVSDDRRVRRVAEGLSATVTGIIGVVVRAVSEDELTREEGNQLVERIDERGLHMTARLRQRAIELIEDAAERE